MATVGTSQQLQAIARWSYLISLATYLVQSYAWNFLKNYLYTDSVVGGDFSFILTANTEVTLELLHYCAHEGHLDYKYVHLHACALGTSQI